MSENENETPAENTSNSPDSPPPFPKLDGTGYVAPVPANVEDLLNAAPAAPTPPASEPVTPTSTPTAAPTPAAAPVTSSSPEADIETVARKRAAQVAYPELFDTVDDNRKLQKSIKRSKNKALGEKRITPGNILLTVAAIGLFAALGYMIYYLLVLVPEQNQSTPTIGQPGTGQQVFNYPDPLPAGLGGQSLTNDPADQPTLDLFASQATQAGNPRSFAAFYGPTPKVAGVSFLVYGAEMTPAEQEAVKAVGPIKNYVNETAAAYVGRAAEPISLEPTQTTGPYGGTTWCQTARLDGAPDGTYCYWSDGTYYVAIARTAGPEGAPEFANNIVQELGLKPAN